MERIFLDIINMSLTGSIAILCVLLARQLLRRAPKLFSYLLWAVVGFRLLCPVSFSAHVSLFGILQEPVVEQGQMIYIAADMQPLGQAAEAVRRRKTDRKLLSGWECPGQGMRLAGESCRSSL